MRLLLILSMVAYVDYARPGEFTYQARAAERDRGRALPPI